MRCINQSRHLAFPKQLSVKPHGDIVEVDEIICAARGQQAGSGGEAFDCPFVGRVRRLALQAGAVLHTNPSGSDRVMLNVL